MLFEFQCEKCEAITEAIIRSGVEEIKCPKCDGLARKIISAPNFYIHGFNADNGYSHEKGIKPKGGTK